MQVFDSGSKSSRKHRDRPLMSDINVTPLVDVMLVLLIIFMITAPLMQHGLDVQLPQASAPAVDVKDVPTITLKSNNRIFWKEDEVRDLMELTERLKGYLGGDKSREVYFRADKMLEYGFVVKVLAAVKGAGVSNIGMVTEPPES